MLSNEEIEGETMSSASEPAPRPRLEARRRAFMEAALAAFLEKGYAGTTLDDVIARSGGSRQTLYALFGGKQGLFESLLAERSAAVFEDFPTDDVADQTPDKILRALGARYLTIITTPEALGLYRLVVAESAARKEVAELFWRAGPGNARQLFARYFASLVKCQSLALDDPDEAAREFMGMLLGTLHMECVLGLHGAPTAAEIEVIARNVVKQVLDGCRVMYSIE
jgi:TetR/AcrR family transcriptional repressor of mexJK operon